MKDMTSLLICENDTTTDADIKKQLKAIAEDYKDLLHTYNKLQKELATLKPIKKPKPTEDDSEDD